MENNSVELTCYKNKAMELEVDFKSEIRSNEENKKSFLSNSSNESIKNSLERTDKKDKFLKTVTFRNTDEALEYLGEFGRKKRIASSLVFLIIFVLGWNEVAYLFYGLDSPWECKNNFNSTCRYNGTFLPDSPQFEERCKIDRNSWRFTKTQDYSMITEYGLICEKKETGNLLLYFTPCGRFIGFIPAMLADRYGRKPILFICALMLGVINVIAYFTYNMIVVVITLILTVTFQLGALASGYIIVSEIVGPKKRALVANLYWSAYPASFCLLSFVAYLIPYWRKARLVMCIPAFLLLLLWRFVPESPRWLHVSGHIKKAEMELTKQSDKCNVNVKLKKISKDESKVSVKDLFKTKELLKLDALYFSINFLIAIIYFGVNMSAAILAGNFYLDFAMIAAVEIPANLLLTYFCNRFGRKPTALVFILFCCLIFGGISFIPQSPFGSGYAIARSALGVLAKFCVTISFNAEFLQVTESYPTSIRSLGLCLINAGVLLGNACAPWLTLGLHSVASYLPFAVMSGISLIIALLYLFTKETRGLPTLEVMEKNKNRSDSAFT